jgi:hypothetical protein
MMRHGVYASILMLILVGPLTAQKTLRVGVHSVGMTYTEVSESSRSQGVGGAATLAIRWRRFGLEGLAIKTHLVPDNDELEPYDFVQWDVRFNYWIAPIFAIEIGGEWWGIDPEFAAQEVGTGRVGFVSQYALARISEIWVRGAYLVNPRFSGGGEAGLAVELGLGVAVGTSNGLFRVQAESDFQRIDREVNGIDVPIQLTQARLGVVFGF